MQSLRRLFASSVGKKYVMALSGVLLIGFLVAHLAGNLLIFKGSDAYNAYATKLHALGPLLWAAEIGLVALFGAHIVYALWLTATNRASRGGKDYEVRYTSKQRTSFLNLAPRAWMAISGSIVLAFLVLHMVDMRFGLRDVLDPTFGEYVDEGLEDETGRPLIDRYGRAVQVLGTPLSFGLYTVGAILLGFHLAHGASSWFRSLGLSVAGVQGLLNKAGVTLAVVLAAGFASIPIYVWAFDVNVAPLSRSEVERTTEGSTGLAPEQLPGEGIGDTDE